MSPWLGNTAFSSKTAFWFRRRLHDSFAYNYVKNWDVEVGSRSGNEHCDWFIM